MPYTPIVLLLLLAVNVVTFFAFAQDKARAVAGGRRIPENDLLFLALFGGSPAAFCARQVFRHKTRKQPFSTWLQLIAALQLGGAIGWFLL